MLFICYPKCSTCKKASEWLVKNNIKFHERDIKSENPNYDELNDWYNKSGLDIKRFFNTSGLVYRELKLKDKFEDMNLEEKLKLLASEGMLVKRPLLVADDFVLVGFKEKDWEERVL